MTTRWTVLLLLLTSLAVVASAQARGEVVLLAPAPGTVISGPSTLAAEVNPPGLPVREVAFIVDGRPACTARVRPFECRWDAGSESNGRSIRVVAELMDGEKLFVTRRTKAADLSPAIFKTSTNAVVVMARVTDNRGRVMTGLTADRFRLLEDGVPQQIEALLQSDTPASVLLCLDVSSSMVSVLPELKRAAGGFLDALRSHDQPILAVFNTEFKVLAGPDATATERRASLERITPTGGTALFDSLIRAADRVRTMPSPRAVVAFTDGLDGDSRASADTVRKTFQANDIALYLVVQGTKPAPDSSGGRLARLAEETGGSAWFDPRISSLGRQFTSIVGELSNRYMLVYSPRRPLGDDQWRTIKVEIDGKPSDYVVHSREGYVASRRDGEGR